MPHTKKKNRKRTQTESKHAKQPEKKATQVSSEKQRIAVEYVQATIDESIPVEFQRIFQRFTTPTELESDFPVKQEEPDGITKEELEEEDDSSEDEMLEMAKSDRKLKKAGRPTVAELKKNVDCPHLVDWWDVSADDPYFLIMLKSVRNSVPVPQHWSMKRKYLQGKRGIEKPPFELPKYIADTGVGQMREAIADKEQKMTLKAKMRAKTRPKMNRVSMDYARLYDAFFRFQTKPRNLTRHGQLYYERKEFEVVVKEKRPGQLSHELREALGMTGTVEPHLIPPPWLLNMQRFGPPPSYPNLKIPGLNSPIPEGAKWGYEPGAWGKPPVDEYNRPLYGDPFGVFVQYQKQVQLSIEANALAVPPERKLWGEIVQLYNDDDGVEVDEEGEQEVESEEDTESTGIKEYGVKQAVQEIDIRATNTTSYGGKRTREVAAPIPEDIETPDTIVLQKNLVPLATASDSSQSLYTVLKQTGVNKSQRGHLGGTDYTYVLNSGKPGEQVELSINPDEADNMTREQLEQRYQNELLMTKNSISGSTLPIGDAEDLSQMVNDYISDKQQNSKKRKVASDTTTTARKTFKF